MVGESLGIINQFQGVDEITVEADGSLRLLERVEGGKHQVSLCSAPPIVVGWATGHLPEPPNNPQVGMMNMRSVMPALQKAKTVQLSSDGMSFVSVDLPEQRRNTRIVKDASVDEVAQEIVDWVRGS